MSGNVDEPTGDAELTKQVMEKFSVNEKAAGQIIAFAYCMALDMMKKWTSNLRKRQKEKADDIYRLIRKWKVRVSKGVNSSAIIDEIEKMILELCVES